MISNFLGLFINTVFLFYMTVNLTSLGFALLIEKTPHVKSLFIHNFHFRQLTKLIKQ